MLDGYVVETDPRAARRQRARSDLRQHPRRDAGGEAWAVVGRRRSSSSATGGGPSAPRARPGEPMLQRAAARRWPRPRAVRRPRRRLRPGALDWTTVIDAKASGLGAFSGDDRGFAGEIRIAAARGVGRLDGRHDVAAGRRARPPASRASPSPLPGGWRRGLRRRRRRADAAQGRGAVRRRPLPARVHLDQGAARLARPARLGLGARRARGRGGSSGGRQEAVPRHGPLVRHRLRRRRPSRAASSGLPRRPASGATPRRCGGRRTRSRRSISRCTAPSRTRRAACGSRPPSRCSSSTASTWRVHPLPRTPRRSPNQTASLAILARRAGGDDGERRPAPHIVLDLRSARRGTFARARARPAAAGRCSSGAAAATAAWVRTGAPCAIQALEDGRFHLRAGPQRRPALCEQAARAARGAPTAAVWFGTTDDGRRRAAPRRVDARALRPRRRLSRARRLQRCSPRRPERVLAGGRDVLRRARLRGRWTVRQRGARRRPQPDAARGTAPSGLRRARRPPHQGRRLADQRRGRRPARRRRVRRCSRTAAGRIWAGTSRGLSLYDPGADRDPPRTVLVEDQRRRGAARRQRQPRLHRRRSLEVHAGRSAAASRTRIDGGAWSAFRPAAAPRCASCARPTPLRGPGDGPQRQRRSDRDLRLRRAVPVVPAIGLPGDARRPASWSSARSLGFARVPVPAARARQAGGRNRQPLQERVPRQHEPRDPHADERRSSA